MQTYTITPPTGMVRVGIPQTFTVTPVGSPPGGEQVVFVVPGVSTSPFPLNAGANTTSITFPTAGNIPIYANAFPTPMADPYNSSNPLVIAVLPAPTDFQATVYGKLWDAIQAGVTAYNAAVSAGVLSGCKAVATNQLFDDRPANGNLPGRTVEKIAKRAPADYPQIRLQITGQSRLTTPMKTFALAAGVSGADAVRPITITLLQTITYDTVLDSGQTPLEAYIDSATDGLYPKLGLTYCRDFECTARRSDENVNKIKRTIRRNTITVRLWPHLSQI